MRMWVMAAFAIWMWAPSAAEAQVCDDGRVSAGGYCCWPGQTFDVAANRCAGPPVCPAGFVGVGAECERSTTGRLPSSIASTPGWVPSEATDVPLVHHRDAGLMGGGAALFFSGYLGTVLTHAFLGSNTTYIGGATYYATVAPLWPLTFIPVFHNFSMIGNNGGGAAAVMWIVGFLAGAMEVGGLVMLVTGEIGYDEAPAGWSFVPSAPGADAGGSLQLSF